MLGSLALRNISERLSARATAVLQGLENKHPQLLIGWLLLISSASLLRLLFSPHFQLEATALTPYLLLIFAPAVSFVLALRWFDQGNRLPQARRRLAAVGRWRAVPEDEARRHPLYGPSGIMVSLLVGMLLNLPVRAAEYLVTMPAISAGAPEWLATLHFMMTVDAVLLSSLYVVAFVAALRRVPLFPRLLLVIWLLDITMQLMIAQAAFSTNLPDGVAEALHALLQGNIKKTLISVALWLPYLLLSVRVNVTFRNRVPA